MRNKPKYRTRTEIATSVLRASTGRGVTGYGIRRDAFLSQAQLASYTKLLMEKDLLVYDKESEAYKTTKTGLQVLRTYDAFKLVGGLPV